MLGLGGRKGSDKKAARMFGLVKGGTKVSPCALEMGKRDAPNGTPRLQMRKQGAYMVKRCWRLLK